MSSLCSEASRRLFNLSVAERWGSFGLGPDQTSMKWNFLKRLYYLDWGKAPAEVFYTKYLNLRNTWQTVLWRYTFLFKSLLIVPTCLSCRALCLLVEKPVKHKVKIWRDWKNCRSWQYCTWCSLSSTCSQGEKQINICGVSYLYRLDSFSQLISFMHFHLCFLQE